MPSSNRISKCLSCVNLFSFPFNCYGHQIQFINLQLPVSFKLLLKDSLHLLIRVSLYMLKSNLEMLPNAQASYQINLRQVSL